MKTGGSGRQRDRTRSRKVNLPQRGRRGGRGKEICFDRAGKDRSNGAAHEVNKAERETPLLRRGTTERLGKTRGRCR